METTALQQIQQQLVCPKNQLNTFGKYKYRSCEDILTAVKPHLAATNCEIVLSDRLECPCSEWVFVVARAELRQGDKVLAAAEGMARHEPQKKGMDASQISGASSSYARKYALNGLLAIDDNTDADRHNGEPERKKGVDLAALKTEQGTTYLRGFENAEAAIAEIGKTRLLNDEARKYIREVLKK